MISLHLFRCPLISPNNVLEASVYKLCPFFCEIYFYFIIFNAMINTIVFMTSLLDHSLLACRNTGDLCTLILNLSIQLDSFVISKPVCVYVCMYTCMCMSVYSLGFSTYKNRSFAN